MTIEGRRIPILTAHSSYLEAIVRFQDIGHSAEGAKKGMLDLNS